MDHDTIRELPTERLEAEITMTAAHLSAAEARFLAMIAEFDRREAYLDWGCGSAAQWLSWKCGIEVRSAQEKLRVARALEDLPMGTEQFAAGKLSYSKVRAITRVATPEVEEALVEFALQGTAAHLESIVRAWRGVLSREEEEARAVSRRENRSHDFDWDDDGHGSLVGNYRLPPEDGATVVAALDAAAEQVRKQHSEVGIRASFADALREMADSYLAHGPAARKAGDRYLAMISVGADVLAFDSDGECVIYNGPALASETARRLSCDSSGVVVLRGPNGEVLDVGRKTRTIRRPSSARCASATRNAAGPAVTSSSGSTVIMAATGRTAA